jgi:hypothetical protein
VPGAAEDIAVIVTDADPDEPGDIVKELGVGILHVSPAGQETALSENVLDPQAELSLFVTVIVYVRSCPGFPVWLLGVIETVGFARMQEDNVVVLDVEVVDPQLALATHRDSIAHTGGLQLLVCHIWFAVQPSRPQP